MHPEMSSQVPYQWQPSVIHDISPSNGMSLSSTIDMTRSFEEQQKQASSSSTITHLFRRVSNAVHGNTTIAQERPTIEDYDEKEREQPPSPVSTAVDEENDPQSQGRFYLNQDDQSFNQEHISTSSSSVPQQQRRTAKSCLVAIFMITVGTLLALAFILIGIGKALSAKAENAKSTNTTTTISIHSSLLLTGTSSATSMNPIQITPVPSTI